MTSDFSKSAAHRVAALGFVLPLPGGLFAVAAILQARFGINVLMAPLEATTYSDTGRLALFNLFSPIVFVGGALVASALNIYAITGLSFRKENSGFATTISVHGSVWNVLVTAASVLMCALFVLYAIGENFVILAR